MDIEKHYQSTLNYLFERLPMFSRIGKAALKNDLNNTLQLCKALGNPETQFESIHIAGTNGKGSVSHGLATIFQDAGYKTGLYTSPHLVDFRERIRINGALISKEWVIDFVKKHKQLIEDISPSFFEITVAMTFQYFAEENVEMAIIETGLGGRLDSTNVITPVLSIITNISYDHKDLLGNTLTEIAREKAGIIKPGIPVIIGEAHEETKEVFKQTSQNNFTDLQYASDIIVLKLLKKDENYQYFNVKHLNKNLPTVLQTDLLGNYQYYNLRTILASVNQLIYAGFNLNLPSAIQSLKHIKTSTGLKGRWELLNHNPLIICDVAHNTAGLKEVLEQWAQVKAFEKHIIIGFVKDKEVKEALSLFPKEAFYYFCNAQIPRALPAMELSNIADSLGLKGIVYPAVKDAITGAKKNMKPDDALLITGSFFIVGEAIKEISETD